MYTTILLIYLPSPICLYLHSTHIKHTFYPGCIRHTYTHFFNTFSFCCVHFIAEFKINTEFHTKILSLYYFVYFITFHHLCKNDAVWGDSKDNNHL